MASAAAAHAPPDRPVLSGRPWVGIAAVLLGAFISTLSGRLSSFGLADIRGALGAGFDEAAWISTAQGSAQMLIGPIAVWLGIAWGPRRVLTGGCLLFAVATLLTPFSQDLTTFILLQVLASLGSGCFIPLTIGFVVRSLPPPLWAVGITAYALNLEMSLNISASLEGWFVEHASWRWIFWQTVPLAGLMVLCIRRGIPPQPFNKAAAQSADLFGMISVGLGLALIYAGLDQGNRLDWSSSGLVVGLLSGGGLLLVAFVLHELRAPTPWLDLRYVVTGVMPILLLLVAAMRLVILSTSYLIPQYLTTTLGDRALQVGGVLAWIALPQLVIAPVVALLLRAIDTRLAAAVGLLLVAFACLSVGHGLYAGWGEREFLQSQLFQAVGQTLTVSSAIFLGVLTLKPKDALTFGAMLQVARLMGGELGFAFIATFVRRSEQVASQRLGESVTLADPDVMQRIRSLAGAVAARSAGADDASARATALLAGTVRTQANIIAYIDGFVLIGWVAIAMLVLLALVPAIRDHPAGPRRRRPA